MPERDGKPSDPAQPPGGPSPGSGRQLPAWARPAALAALLLLIYAPSLGGGFLNYDDGWLVAQNPVLQDGSAGALARIWTDLGDPARMALGAEYLPVRDMSHWLEARAGLLGPVWLRTANLLVYVAAALLWRALLRRVLPAAVAEGAAWLFALHPVHAESVAWIAGRKDVFSLLFVAAGLLVHVRERGSRGGRAAKVAVCFALAALSKATSVTAPLLLPICDLLRGRSVDRRTLVLALAPCAALAAVAVHVGHVVHMTTAPLGGSRLAALATMGPLLWRFVAWSWAPLGLSVTHDVTVRGLGDPVAWLAWLAWLGALGGALVAWRRRVRLPLLAAAWFAVAFAPTSQVVFPLQNVLADRYLLLAVMGPLLLATWAIAPRLLQVRGGRALAATAVLVMALLTAERALVFGDSVALWQDALGKTRTSAIPPYQLALALEARGRAGEAEAAFGEAMRRAQPDEELGRKAANDLAILLSRDPARMPEAEAILRDLVRRFPSDPKALNNLAELVARQGRSDEARALFDDLVRRFPGYAPGQANRAKRFGVQR